MRISRLSKEIKGYQIISASDGQIIGKVEDVLIDTNKLEVAAVVTSKGNLLDSTTKAVLRKDIQVWGEDVILTSGPDVVREQNKIINIDEWNSAFDDLKGKQLLNTDGEQIAELDDVVIDSNAKIVGYDLSKVSIDGPIADTRRIHVNTTKVFGADALIIDTSKLYQWEL